MTEKKLTSFILDEYLEDSNDILVLNRAASCDKPENIMMPTQYELKIIQTIVKIILTNFTLTDKNASH